MFARLAGQLDRWLDRWGWGGVGWTSRRLLCIAPFLTLNIMHKIFNQICSDLWCIYTDIVTSDFYHLIPLPVTFTLAGSHWVKANQNLLASFFCTQVYGLIRMKFDMVLEQFKFIVFILLLSVSFRSNRSKCCCADYIKKIFLKSPGGMHSDIF